MSRPPNTPTTLLLSTARWLTCVDKLSVRAMRLCHMRTATDRIAAVCRFVKAEARQRIQDARAHGVAEDGAAGPAARRPAPARRTTHAPTNRAASTVQAPRVQRPTPIPSTIGALHRAVPSQHGPRAAVIAALNAQATLVRDERLQQIAREQQQLHVRLDIVEGQIAASATAPVVATVPPTLTVTRYGLLTTLVRRWCDRAHTLLQRFCGARP